MNYSQPTGLDFPQISAHIGLSDHHHFVSAETLAVADIEQASYRSVINLKVMHSAGDFGLFNLTFRNRGR